MGQLQQLMDTDVIEDGLLKVGQRSTWVSQEYGLLRAKYDELTLWCRASVALPGLVSSMESHPASNTAFLRYQR